MGQVIMGWIQDWFAQNATVGTLLLLMGCDVTTGIMLAIVNKKLNSSASTKGMIRKSIALMFVGIGQALEKFFGNTPVSETIAIGFCLSELMSIAENAGLLGVPLPPPLKRIMSVLAEQAKDNSGRPDLVESTLHALEHKDGSQ
ncbi:MAG: phage holin family protein [Chloroflexi bacterium]|nr:phage holin family protein [Chloroflexota bacterium]